MVPVKDRDEFVFGEVYAQVSACQEIAAKLNGGIPPEITIRIRPLGTSWIGCQCGIVFVSASAGTLNEATREFHRLLLEKIHESEK